MEQSHTFQTKGFIVWFICALFFLYEFLLRTVVGTFQHPIMADLELTSMQFSLLSTTLFLFVYGLMQIPIGIIVGRIGLKRSVLIGALVCTLSSFGFSYSLSYSGAVFFRVLMGLGASFGFICLLVSVSDWMPHKYSAIFIGLSQFIGTMGPLMAAGPLETLSESSNVNWRVIFFLLGWAGLFIATLSLLFVEDNRQYSGSFTILKRPRKSIEVFLHLIRRKQAWVIAIFSAAIYFSLEYLSENEGRAFLSLKGISSHTASYFLTLSWLGYAIGCPAVGLFSDFFERRKSVMLFSSFIALPAIILIVYSHTPWVIGTSFFLLGVSASAQSIGFATMAEQFSSQYVSAGMGLNNALISTVSSLNAPLIGLWLDSIRGDKPLTVEMYQTPFMILVGSAVIALFLSFFYLRETYCKSLVEFTPLRRCC